MDRKVYSKAAVDKYMNDNLFFNDAKLKKYFDRYLKLKSLKNGSGPK